MSASGIQDTRNANPLPVNNGLGLASGLSPRIIPLNVDLTVAQSVLVDLTQQQQGGQIGPIQTIYIDNSDNGQEVSVVSQVLNQELTIPAGDSCILPFFLSPQAPKFTVNTTGGVRVPIALFNIPLPSEVWGASFGQATFQNVNGNLSMNVVDTALQALIANIGGAGNGLNVNVLSTVGAGGGGTESVLIGSVQGTGAAVAIGGNSGAGLKWNVTMLEAYVTNNAANGVGENKLLQIFEGGAPFTVFANAPVYIPLATPATPLIGNQRLLRLENSLGLFTNDNANSSFSFQYNGTALTVGTFGVNLYGFAK